MGWEWDGADNNSRVSLSLFLPDLINVAAQQREREGSYQMDLFRQIIYTELYRKGHLYRARKLTKIAGWVRQQVISGHLMARHMWT